MNGRLARRYFRERNKLQGQKRKIEGAASGLSQTASSVESGQASSGFVSTAPTEGASYGVSKTTNARRQASVTKPEKTAVRKQSTLVYLLALVGIFACEGVLNKKAFEVFSQSDTTTWILVSGLAIALILAAHMIGKSWRRVEDKRNAAPALVVLCAVGVGAAGVLGTMRYLAVDNQRQQTISVLNQEISAVQSTNAGYVSQLKSLDKKRHLSPTDTNSLVILKSRVASATAEIASARSQLSAANHPQAVDQVFVAIPLFILLNLFLTAVASVLSYYHYDPAAADAAAIRRHLRRRQFAAWVGSVLVTWRERRAQRRAGREQRRQRKELAAATAAAVRKKNESDELIRRGTALTAAGTSLDEVLDTLDSSYRAACAETEKLYEATIRRYWGANNRAATREARNLARNWRKANRDRAHDAVERPQAASWKRPTSQDAPLPFQRPAELE